MKNQGRGGRRLDLGTQDNQGGKKKITRDKEMI